MYLHQTKILLFDTVFLLAISRMTLQKMGKILQLNNVDTTRRYYTIIILINTAKERAFPTFLLFL